MIWGGGEQSKKSVKIPKGLIRICKSKDRQHNGQKKKDNHIKLKIE